MEKLISLCMIVKNEEDVLERCLKYASPYVDEIIIVDTGSTDATKQIANKYTDLIIDFEWINDFSAAKNEAIKRATSKWILVLDADEYIDTEEMKALRDFLAKEIPREDLVYCLPIINFLGKSINTGNILESSADRVFPNHQHIYFIRPIHEQLDSQKPNITIRNKKIPYKIYHTGYLTDVIAKKEKSKRNQSIFSEMKQNKQLEDYDYFTLGNEYSITKDYKKAKYYYSRALQDKYKHTAWYSHCLVSLINVCFELDHYKEAWDLIQSELSAYKQFPEYDVIIGLAYNNLGFTPLAEKHYLLGINSSDTLAAQNKNPWLISPDYGYNGPHRMLSKLYYQQKDINKTIYHLTKTIMNNPMDLNSLYLLIQLLSQTTEARKLIQTLDQLYPEPSPLQVAMLLQTSINLGLLEMSEHYLKIYEQYNLSLKESDALRLLLMQNNRNDFDANLNSLSSDELYSEPIVTLLCLAAFIWNDTYYLDLVATDHKQYESIQATKTIVELDIIPASLKTAHQKHIASLLIDLFTLRKFDTYDQYVNKTKNSFVINKLANFFYKTNQLELAIDYYSIMLNQHPDELDLEGYENLSIIHLVQNYITDGLSFLKKAIEMAPEKKKLYVMFCLYCDNLQEKERYKQKFIETFPQYQNLPFVKHL